MENLWPQDFGGVSKENPPIVILREQAYLLGPLTNNVLEARVDTRPVDEDGHKMRHDFFLVAPALGLYQYKLFHVSHAVVSVYPAKLSTGKSASNEEEFRSLLRSLFDSEEVKGVIQSLRSQSLALVPA